jgi:RND family efflux transporter MFP subunit
MTDTERDEPSTNEENNGLGVVTTLLVCGILVLVGAGLTAVVFWTQPGTTRGDRPEQMAMLVDVTRPDSGTFRPRIEAMGTVRPAQDVNLRPRVGGEITRRYDRFTAGGYVEKGDTIIKIDQSDYLNTLQQRRSAYRQAKSQLEIEQGQQEVAREEFELLDEEVPDGNRALVLRKPQLNSARAEVKSARAALEQARLDLRRTTVQAPFDAHILSRNVSLGSQVSAGENLGRFVGLDKFWIDATISVDKLRYLSIPDTPGGDGARVRVENSGSWATGEHRVGELSQLIGQLDSQARMARVRVAVRDPMVRDVDDMDSPPLVIGSYVRTIMQGSAIENVARIDRDYVREDQTVWLMEDGELAIESVDVVFQDRNHAYIREGLSGGDRVVTSSLTTVVEGTELRLNGPQEGSESSDETSGDTRTASVRTSGSNVEGTIQ